MSWNALSGIEKMASTQADQSLRCPSEDVLDH